MLHLFIIREVKKRYAFSPRVFIYFSRGIDNNRTLNLSEIFKYIYVYISDGIILTKMDIIYIKLNVILESININFNRGIKMKWRNISVNGNERL